ncbi:MAG TPA: beta-galactosidase, partial [Bacillota bacterium]|nr:beta-galactosidase [Bacillota bacterium]
PAYQFVPAEGWRLRAEGHAGATRLEGKNWSLDFSQGAQSLCLAVPDRVLLGSVDKLRLRVRGRAKGHPVRLVLRTHFMTFHKVIGEFSGDGDQELVTEGPPGPGWEWHSGENDGKLHGPLRLAEIQLGANGHADRCALELRELVIDASCPKEKRCVLLAKAKTGTDSPGFVAQMRAVSDKSLAGELSWVLRDWEGQEVGHGQQAVTIPAKTALAEFQLPITPNQTAGRKFLEAEFNLTIAGQVVSAVQSAWLAPLEGPGDATLQPESPFGMGLYLCRYGGDARGLETMDRAARLARDAGVKWSREDFSWGRMERQRGQYDWSFYDNLLACARRNGITVYAIVGYWTSWTKPYTAEGIEDYVRFLKALVGRYRHQVKQWEIWNEPNIFFWQGPKEMYAELLTKSYAAVKEVDPEAQVLGLSTAGIDTQFIDRMLALQAPFDILTIHPYRTHLNDQAFIDELKKVSDQVKRPEGQRRPVWLTEMGWATHSPHNTLQQDFAPTTQRAQAQLIARSYLCAIVSGVEPRTFWYDFRNDGEDPIYFEHQMGIVYSDFRPKPALISYATLARVLKGKTLDQPLPVGQGIFAYNFKPSPGCPGNVIALWHPTADARAELPVKARRLTRVNAVGERTELQAVDGKVSGDLKQGAPVFLVEPSAAQ